MIRNAGLSFAFYLPGKEKGKANKLLHIYMNNTNKKGYIRS